MLIHNWRYLLLWFELNFDLLTCVKRLDIEYILRHFFSKSQSCFQWSPDPFRSHPLRDMPIVDRLCSSTLWCLCLASEADIVCITQTTIVLISSNIQQYPAWNPRRHIYWNQSYWECGHFPFDQIFRFEIPRIPCDEWNSIFLFAGLTCPRSSGSKFRSKMRNRRTEDSFTFMDYLLWGCSKTLK